MKNKETLSCWDKMWTKDNYYASHDISTETDGISQLLFRALKGIKENSSMLEVGSGPATRSIPITKEKQMQLSLIDILVSAHSLAQNRADRYGVLTKCIVGDGLNLPVADESYDVVISIGLNEHFYDEERSKIFQEMWRVTKKGGRTVVIVPNLLGIVGVEQAVKEINGTWTFGPAKLFDKKELRGKMELNDFEKIKLFGVSVFSSPVRLLPVNLQRVLFSSELWNKITSIPGNLNTSFILNQWFGEEIMAVGYK